jgi:hypothetical protein
MAFTRSQNNRPLTPPWVHGWLLVCLVFGAIAPGLSHAVSNISVKDDQQIAICTASGMTYIRWQTPETTPAAQPSHQSQQCLICTFSGDPPIVSQARFGISHQTPERPSRQIFESVNRSPCHWVIAAIRVPPAFFRQPLPFYALS